MSSSIHPVAVGHRVVHGGPEFDQPVLVTEDVLHRLEQYIPLAPLHQPHNLAPIRTIMADLPGLPQVACFDTAFHRKHSAVADHYAIPEQFYAEGVRRYGFHGLSYEYIAGRLAEIAPEVAKKKVIVAHLGSGASMCALSGGQSVESTMGFTALDGLPMGTRAGQIDPGVVLYLIEQKGMSAHEVQHLLYHDCGLKGLSGISNDMRELEASPDPRAAFAIDYFVYRIALFTGTLAAALGGLDAFVFTAGIGEHSPSLRARLAAKLSWLGVKLDQTANTGGRQLISAAGSAVAVYVIPTDEELMIARHTLALIGDAKQAAREVSMKTISLEKAVAMIPNGASLMIGGFMAVGTPERVMDEIVRQGKRDLTVIANDTASPGKGIGKLVRAKLLRKLIASHIGLNPETQQQMNAGELEVELIPQGTLVERIRCGGYGLGGVLTPTGVGTTVEEGKQRIEVNGKPYLLETALRADFALIHAFVADYLGNLGYALTARNFNPVMAMAADTVIACADNIVPVGVISPDHIMTPAPIVDHLITNP